MATMRFIHRGKGVAATMRLLKDLKAKKYLKNLDKYGQRGVELLSQATPVDTGKTAASWTYKIKVNEKTVSLRWINTNENKGENVAVLIQFGHGTTNGGFVKGRDFINPALRQLFDEIVQDVWKEVTAVE